MSGTNVVAFNEADRLRALAAGWRRAPLPEVVARARALALAQAAGRRLPLDVYEAWVQMSAVIAVCGGRA
jgi:hypothetical protein